MMSLNSRPNIYNYDRYNQFNKRMC